MKKIIIILTLIFVASCAGMERDLVEDIIDSDKTKLNRCEVEGFVYKGMDADMQKKPVLKVLMIHGVGIHHPGYSRRIQENLAANLNLNVMSRLSKNIKQLDPQDHKTPIGNLQITYWQNRDASKNMLFYELTWSEITTPDKQVIAFDTTEQYSKFRVPFNNMMKKFLDNTLPDPLVYLVDKNNLILDSSKQSLCWMLKTNWNNIPDNQSKVCDISTYDEIKSFNQENLLFITHSLGSKILMDTLVANADKVTKIENDATQNPQDKLAIKNLQNKEVTIFMLANQLPILQIGHPLPQVHNQINAYCEPQGNKYHRRLLKGLNIVAFSDPNDILSYAIPQNFADKYIDSRVCPRVTNVSVNVAPEISAFGVGVVDPVSAHTNYDNSPKVINLITRGTENFDTDEVLDKQCRFIKMEKDNKMR